MSSDSGEMKETAANCLSLAREKMIPTCLVFLVVLASNYGYRLVCPFFSCLQELVVFVITALFGSAAAAPGLSKVSFVFRGFIYLLVIGMTVLTVVCFLRKLEGKVKMLKFPDCGPWNAVGYFWFHLGDNAHDHMTSIKFCKIPGVY